MENLLETGRAILEFIIGHMFLWNMVFVVVIIFFERRDPKSVWAWFLLLYFIPIIGFIFYLFLGQNMRKQKMFKMKELEDHLNEAIRNQEHQLKSGNIEELNENISEYKDLILYNLETSGAVLTDDNSVDLLVDGNEKFNTLIEDLKRAEHTIHMQYYIIRDDVLFSRIKEVLAEKAAQGVKVRILFDAMGCRFTNQKCWKKLRAAGVDVVDFFPAILGRLQLRMNYRNHRKIVVIDDRIAYVGGFNVGKEYVGLDSRFGYWRDTHLRIQGSAVYSLQLRFILDWNYAARENLLQDASLLASVYEPPTGNCDIQIISSGPDTTVQSIRNNYLRLIAKAKKSIYIQTPYFIPDDAILSALMIAVKSGIEVNIMIPCKPDHPFVYWATYSYVGDMIMAGAKCYTYDNGFLHSKGMVVDGKVLCYGTANMDIRSFSLNFEVNAVLYDPEKAEEMEQIFLEDLHNCTQITRDSYSGRNLSVRVKEQICRLLSPLL